MLPYTPVEKLAPSYADHLALAARGQGTTSLFHATNVAFPPQKKNVRSLSVGDNNDNVHLRLKPVPAVTACIQKKSDLLQFCFSSNGAYSTLFFVR